MEGTFPKVAVEEPSHGGEAEMRVGLCLLTRYRTSSRDSASPLEKLLLPNRATYSSRSSESTPCTVNPIRRAPSDEPPPPQKKSTIRGGSPDLKRVSKRTCPRIQSSSAAARSA